MERGQPVKFTEAKSTGFDPSKMRKYDDKIHELNEEIDAVKEAGK